MIIFQIIILLIILLYIIFNSINFMDNYSVESRNNFREERNSKIIITIIIFIVLYLAGSFSEVLELINK
jgi:di/tricarboxylate transporter